MSRVPYRLRYAARLRPTEKGVEDQKPARRSRRGDGCRLDSKTQQPVHSNVNTFKFDKFSVLFSNVDMFNIDKQLEIRARLSIMPEKRLLLAFSAVKPKNFRTDRELSEYTLKCLSIGTPKNNKFSICPKWKIHYFQVSQNLGRVQPHYNVLDYWDT